MWWALSTIAAHLRAAIGLRAAFGNFLLHENGGLFTVTFEDKVPTLVKCPATVYSWPLLRKKV